MANISSSEVKPRFLCGSNCWDMSAGANLGFVCVTLIGWMLNAALTGRLAVPAQWACWTVGYAVSVALFFGTRKRLPTLAWSILASATLTAAVMLPMLVDIIGD